MKKRLSQPIPLDILEYVPCWLRGVPRKPAACWVEIPGLNAPEGGEVVFHEPAAELPQSETNQPVAVFKAAGELAGAAFDQTAFRAQLLAEGVGEIRARQTASRAAIALAKAGVEAFADSAKAKSHPALAEYTEQSRLQLVKAGRRAFKWLAGLKEREVAA